MIRRRARLENMAIVPASQLPFKEEWRRMASALPPGEALFVVPIAETPLKKSMRQVAATLRARGCAISAIPEKLLD